MFLTVLLWTEEADGGVGNVVGASTNEAHVSEDISHGPFNPAHTFDLDGAIDPIHFFFVGRFNAVNKVFKKWSQ